MSKKLVNLKDGADILVPSVFAGIKTSNLLATVTSANLNYTATQDCYLVGQFYSGYGGPKIDDVLLPFTTDGGIKAFIFFLAKGQNLKIGTVTSGGYQLKIYGVKF